MSLLVLAYHRASAGPHGNDPALLDAHFGLIARRFPCVLPGETLRRGRLNVCLTFDDGYYDFHAVVFPLLEKHGLRAVLAVSPGFLRERVLVPAAERISQSAEVGRVEVAAHGYSHCRLDRPEADLGAEVLVPHSLLAARLGRPVTSFVFPYGRFSAGALAAVSQSYRYVFRLGGGDNRHWNQRLLYRVGADKLASPGAPFETHRLAAYRARRWWNRLRLR